MINGAAPTRVVRPLRITNQGMRTTRVRGQPAGTPSPLKRRLIMRNWILFGLILLCTLAASAPAHAQGFGRIVGTVTDANGAVVANAKVTATQVGKGLSRA